MLQFETAGSLAGSKSVSRFLDQDRKGDKMVNDMKVAEDGVYNQVIKARRLAKRDSKLEAMLKQTCLALSHLNQTPSMRQSTLIIGADSKGVSGKSSVGTLAPLK